jgi:putative thioredoxin
MSSSPFTAAALRGAVDLSAFKRPANGPGARPGGAAGAGSAGSAGAAGAAGGSGAPGASASSGGDLVVSVNDATFQDIATTSLRVPTVVVLWSARLAQTASFVGVMADVARDNGGRFQVASVDVDTSPGLLRAFQIQSVPATIGLVQGQPVPLFVGALPPSEIQPWIDELLKLAVQMGVTGRVSVGDDAPAVVEGADGVDGAEAAEDELPPLIAAAYDAIERGDLDAAIAAYEEALTQNPADTEAALGLSQVRLLKRTEGVDAVAARAAAAADPLDVAAQTVVADLDVLGGHVPDAFARLVDTVRATAGDDRNAARQHLLGLFEVVGASDERVVKARRALMSALF